MIVKIDITFEIGMAHLLCGAVVLPIIACALFAFVVYKLLQKRHDYKELTLIRDNVDGIQRELEAALRRNDNLLKIMRNRIQKECNGLMMTKDVDKEVLHVRDLLDLADEADAKLRDSLAEHRREILTLAKLNKAMETENFANKRLIEDLEGINEAKYKELGEKKRQIQCLEGMIVAKDKELSKKERQIQSLEDNNMAKDKELNEKASQMQELEDDKVAKEEKLCEKERELEELKKQNGLKDEQIEDYQRIIDEPEKERAGQNKEIEASESKAQDFDALMSQNQRNTRSLLTCDEEIETLKKELEERNAEIIKLVQCEKELEQLRKELEDKNRHMDKLAPYETETEELKKEYEEKRGALYEIVSLMKRDEWVVSDSQRKVGELEEELKERSKERDELLTSEATLLQKLAKSQLEINELKTEVQILETEVEMLRSKLEELVNQLEKNMNHLKGKQGQILEIDLRLQMEGYKQERDYLQRVLKEKEVEINNCKWELKHLGTENALNKENLEEFRQKIKVLQKELERRQKENQELAIRNLRNEDELKRKDFEIEVIMKEVEEEQLEQSEFLKARYQAMKDAFDRINEQGEVICLSQEVKEKGKLLEECIAERDSLNKKLEEVKKEKKYQKKRVAEAKRRQKVAEDELSALNGELEVLKNRFDEELRVRIASQMETEELRQKLEERDREADRLVQCDKEVENLKKD